MEDWIEETEEIRRRNTKTKKETKTQNPEAIYTINAKYFKG